MVCIELIRINLLGKHFPALENENGDQVDGDVELVGSEEDCLKLEPGVVVARVIVNMLAAEEATLIDVLEQLFRNLFDHFILF